MKRLATRREEGRLQDLPPPPAGRTGWPWTEETPALPAALPDGRPWPRITVVTPSFNQDAFLEATLRSVLLQGYPDLEHIVMDGGSTDGSVELIRRYEPWLTHWTSGPDRGQSDAINRGFRMATGEIVAWLNSDDIYYPGALATAARGLAGGAADIFIGAMDKVLVEDGRVDFVRRSSPNEGDVFNEFPVFADGRRHVFHFIQPSALWTRRIWQRAGELDERYHYQMDREWMNRALAAGARVVTSDEVLARFTLHPGSKSQDFVHRFHQERFLVYVRQSRLPGFRFVPCLLSSLRPAQQVLVYRANRAAEEGRPVKELVLRNGARALKAARTWIPGLRGRDPLRDGAEEPDPSEVHPHTRPAR